MSPSCCKGENSWIAYEAGSQIKHASCVVRKRDSSERALYILKAEGGDWIYEIPSRTHSSFLGRLGEGCRGAFRCCKSLGVSKGKRVSQDKETSCPVPTCGGDPQKAPQTFAFEDFAFLKPCHTCQCLHTIPCLDLDHIQLCPCNDYASCAHGSSAPARKEHLREFFACFSHCSTSDGSLPPLNRIPQKFTSICTCDSSGEAYHLPSEGIIPYKARC